LVDFGWSLYLSKISSGNSVSLLDGIGGGTSTVLTKIRKLMFDFLWAGGGNKQRIHLCNWETLAKPKDLGGWGFRNLFLFSRALAANSLWHALFKDGIWHNVVKDKYFPYHSVETWLRFASPSQPGASQVWKNLMKSLPIITRWISWQPGNGHSIYIGLDKILGLDRSSLLSNDLREALKACNINLLYQAFAQHSCGFITNQWRSCEELGLTGSLAAEWTTYCKNLISLGYSATSCRRSSHLDWWRPLGGLDSQKYLQYSSS
jgi:hypothetical protein